MATATPRLRLVEAISVEQDGRQLVCLRDPTGYSEYSVSVPPGALPLLQCLDGRHTLRDIQQRVVRLTGRLVPLAELRAMVGKLDRALLLDSPRFARFRDRQERGFRRARIRKAALAGLSYPAQPAAVRRMLNRHFAQAPAPGTGRAASAPPPLALMAPHIDPRRGGPTFARAYRALHAASEADLFVILGVAHAQTARRFVGTRKDFATPLGVARTDARFMQRLEAQLRFDLYEDELVHRREHSIEFQLLYLQHIRRGQRPWRIAPILVGSFHDLMLAGREPIRDREVAGFVQALRRAILGSDGRVCVIAGVDLAHVGARFGDEFTVNREVLAQLERDDRAMLRTLENCDPRGLCRLIYAEHDRRRVDAFPAVYTMLSALELQRGELLDYDQCHEPQTNSVVTFAGMRFW
jgi:AmmeMemoRadiSam system protein B